jgi:hypothetical protein
MSRLYEIRIYEPAVKSGLFIRPERWRYTNVHQYQSDDPALGKLLNYGQGGYWFVNGMADVYDPGVDGLTRAEIVGEIGESRAMEKDRFVNV